MKTIDRDPAYQVQQLDDLASLEEDPRGWFERQPAVGKKAWFLAYVQEGVIWGEIRAGKLVLSCDVFPTEPPFTLETKRVQSAYLFGDAAEVRVWRDGAGFKAARLEDLPGCAPHLVRDDDCLLWGTYVEAEQDGFSLLSDGVQGLHHAVPLIIDPKLLNPNKMHRPVRLKVRRFLVFDEHTGQARLGAFRLVGLTLH